MPKAAIRREVAQQDIEYAAMFYLHEGGELLALRFIDAVEATVRQMKHTRPQHATDVLGVGSPDAAILSFAAGTGAVVLTLNAERKGFS